MREGARFDSVCDCRGAVEVASATPARGRHFDPQEVSLLKSESEEAAMQELSYEYPTRAGLLRLSKIGQRWSVEFNEVLCGHWASPDDAAYAAARHETGVPEWDRTRLPVPDDLKQWRAESA